MALPHLPDDEAPFAPLTGAEQRRLGTVLGDVSTRTLLYSLTGMARDSADAQLIIATLLERLPPGDPDHAPVTPI